MVDRRSGSDPRNMPSSSALEPPKAAPPNAGSNAGSTSASSAASGPSAPIPSLPKGGGAIRGIGEKFSANPVTGTASLQIPLATSPGRGGFHPELALAYDSGAGNGPFGVGWHLSSRRSREKQTKGFRGTTTRASPMSSCSPARKISCPRSARTQHETPMSMPSRVRWSSATVPGLKARLHGSSDADESRMALSIGQPRRPITRRAFMAAHPPPVSPRRGRAPRIHLVPGGDTR